MFPFAAALLLLGPVAAGRSRAGLCAGDLCSFPLPVDFQGAKEACRSLGGQLLTVPPAGGPPPGLEGLEGHYWLSSGAPPPGDGWCPCANVLGWWVHKERCAVRLDGFLCHFPPGDVCGRVGVHAGSDVNYTFQMMDFQLIDSDTFPPGTTAVTGTPGSGELESKHVCFSSNWIRAPWACEVMGGGCEQACTPEPHGCSCSPRHLLHPNGFSCSTAPCADCAPRCDRGYRRTPTGDSCVDVDECKDKVHEEPCTAEGEECVNTEGGYKCRCADGFDAEDGACVNVSICSLCEHMHCPKIHGVYQCACRKGFQVSRTDPTKCEPLCVERDCPSRCITDPRLEARGAQQCFCPHGYVTDTRINVTICTDINECEMEQPCDHTCENLFGGFRCSCIAGFELRQVYKCVRVKEEWGEEGGSGLLQPVSSSPSSPQSAPLPPYVRTGSVLGITVFLALLAALLALLGRCAYRRCGRFELPAFRHPELDIYYLHQVTTGTYKRLSFDRPCRLDPQRL